MVTQSKIAQMAGVSRSTVQRVLNNGYGVNEDVRKRVKEIAELLEYHPNRAGQTLVVQQKNLKIGCIIVESENPFYAELNKGIESKAKEYQSYGIHIIVRKAYFTTEAQLQEIDNLLAEQINALVIQPVVDPSIVKKIETVENMGIPVVTMNTDLPEHNSKFCYVGNNFYLCGKTAANLLALVTDSQCKIGIVTGFENAKSHYDRINGFRDYLKAYPNMQIIEIVANNDDEFESYHVTLKMLQNHPEITALFLVAGGVHGAGRAIKQFPNRKLKVISFDDMPETRKLVKEDIIFATICQQPISQGEMALEVLFNYFIDGTVPSNNRLYTDIQIKVKANIDE